jgi:hypothetical protein
MQFAMLNVESKKFQKARRRARLTFLAGSRRRIKAMKKAKTKANTKKSSRKVSPGGRGSRKPVDLAAIRRQITDLVGNEALGLVNTTIAEAEKGHYAAMKYLFEMVGLYPATAQEAPEADDALAGTLLRRMGMENEPTTETAVTKDRGEAAPAGAGDAVK